MKTPAILGVIAVASVCLASDLAARPPGGPFYYVSPVPGAQRVSAHAGVILRPEPGWAAEHPGWMGRVAVIASQSGAHAGTWTEALDGRTFVFTPDDAFAPGETVTVTGDGFEYRFVVSPTRLRIDDPHRYDCFAATSGRRVASVPRSNAPPGGATWELPDDFPDLDVLVSDHATPGYLFLSNFGFTDLSDPTAPHYLMILDNDGAPVFFRKTPGPGALDFRARDDGRLSYFLAGSDQFYFLDDSYVLCDSIAARGYPTDGHDLQLLSGGGAIVMASDPQIVDMSEIVEDGVTDALVIGAVIQEFDAGRNLVFEWRSWDHFDILDATQIDFTDARVDYVHVNSIEIDDDGNLLLSSRHMDEITKIDRATGDIVWRMGGKHNEFTLLDDDEWFSHQHDVRRRGGGTITLYDNGNFHDPPESRALEYRVDESSKTVTRVWEFRHDPPVYGRAMGNAQRLASGNTLIGWGSATPSLTEVRPDGTTALEVTFGEGVFSYRALRFDWRGVAAVPSLWAHEGNGVLVLDFVQFGATGVAHYNVYRSEAGEPPARAATVEGNRYVVHDFEAGERLEFRVTATDRRGHESAFSEAVAVTPDFSDHGVTAAVTIEPATLNRRSALRWLSARVEIGAVDAWPGDVDPDSVVFDGRVRAAQVEVRPGGRGGVVRLTARFDRAAVLEGLDDGCHEVVVSGKIGDVEFSGLGRFRIVGGAGDDPPGRGGVTLSQNHPNPFNPVTAVHVALDRACNRATLQVYNVSGGLVRTLWDGPLPAGERSISWDGRDDAGRRAPSGVYFLRLRAGGADLTRKMLLVK